MKEVFPTYPENAVEQVILTARDYGLADIVSVSSSHYTKDWKPLPPHVHAGCAEICLCRRGSLKFECAGKRYTALPNDLFISQPGDPHRLLTNHKGVICYWLIFRYPASGKSVLGLPARESAALVRALRSVDRHLFAAEKEIQLLFRGVFAAMKTADATLRRLKLRTLFARILLLVAESSANAPAMRGLSRIDEIACIIARRPSHRFTTAELAAHAKLSESRFTALFRQVVGLPPYAYLTSCRLSEVKRRLAATDASVAVIAHELGFVSAQHLAAQFKKRFGQTPTGYRASLITPPAAQSSFTFRLQKETVESP